MERKRRASIDGELTLINVQLLNLQQKAKELQRIIDALQKMKDAMMTEGRGLQRRKDNLEAQKEPINWLPPELLMQIFVACAESDLDKQDPNYRPSLVISHVCAKWRTIALATQELWSRIVLRDFPNPAIYHLYLERSGKSPLEIDYRTTPTTLGRFECKQVAELAMRTRPHFPRLTTLALETKTAYPLLIYIISSLDDHLRRFPQLRSLTLAISTPNPTFADTPNLFEGENSVFKQLGSSDNVTSPSPSPLFHLKLVGIPPFVLPPAFISNLRSVDLSYSPRIADANERGHIYFLKMSTLCHFLAHTPFLEELVLESTTPYFDVALRLDDSPVANGVNSPLIEMQPVKLNHLKSIDWTYPFPSDVHRFLSIIETPKLEKLELWVEDSRSKRHDTLLAYPVVSSPHKFTRGVISLPSLRDLSLQCDGEESTASVLRKLSIPMLQKVEFTHFDPAAPIDADEVSSLPIFPRLESIFRDPRLLHLAHLTLSHYRLSSEPGRVEAMLGYMPVLTSLSFDFCSGLGRLLAVLQETFVGTITVGGVGDRSRRSVKVCPRLDTLSFWDCQDLGYASLRAVVLSRNRSLDAFEEECILIRPGTLPVVPDGATQTVTREAREGSASGGHTTEEAQMGRKIKPLRTMRRRRPELGEASADMPSTIAATIVTMEESFRPACISFLRVANCKAMEEEEVMSFRDLGVVDVIWAGSG